MNCVLSLVVFGLVVLSWKVLQLNFVIPNLLWWNRITQQRGNKVLTFCLTTLMQALLHIFTNTLYMYNAFPSQCSKVWFILHNPKYRTIGIHPWPYFETQFLIHVFVDSISDGISLHSTSFLVIRVSVALRFGLLLWLCGDSNKLGGGKQA